MKQLHFSSFRQRLNAAFLAVSLVPMLLCSGLLLQIFRLRMTSNAQQTAQQQLSASCEALDTLHSGFLQTAASLQHDPLVAQALFDAEAEDAAVYSQLFDATESVRSFARFDLYDISGRWRYSTQATPESRSLPTNWGLLYEAACAGAGVLVCSASEDPADTAAPLLRAAMLLTDRYGAPVGYLTIGMLETQLRTLLGGTAGAQNELLLLDARWRPVYCTQPAQTQSLADALRGQLLSGKALTGLSDAVSYTVRQHTETGLYLVLQQPQPLSAGTLRLLYSVSALCALACVGLSIVLSLQLSRQVFQPIGRLHHAIRQVGKNDLDVQVPVPAGQHDELGELAQQFNTMVVALRHNQQALLENQRALNRAQIQMLQAQLNPHFLCNTLDTMKWISKINQVPQVALMSTNLADILRFCITPDEFVPLRRELEILNRYVEIQRIRLSESFSYTEAVPEALLSCMVPKMLLQPLAENAILHGLSGVEHGELSVTAALTAQNVLEIRVRDNGCGFPPELLGPYRPPETQTGHLGLFNVDTILRKHYGDAFGLCLENPEGGGACILAQLPAKGGARHMMRVMVVEDEEMIRKGIVMAVDWAALDCVVVGEAANGEQALAVAEDCRPTLIITDLKMPKMDGLEMVRRLREAGSRAYVIILTAYDSFAYAQQAIRLGAVDFLLKPFHDGDLENAVLALQKRIAAQAAPQPEPLPGVKPGPKSRYVREAMSYLEQNCGSSELSVGQAAAQLGLSEGHLSHLFKKETDMTLGAYLTRCRIQKAMALLREGKLKVYEVAEACGYRDIAYFSGTFKKITGKSPSDYQDARG